MKKYLFTGLMAVLALSGAAVTSSDSEGVSVNHASDSEKVKVIVEVTKGLKGLTDEEVVLSQNNVIKSIKKNVTKDFEVVDRYHVLNNALLISIDSDKVDQIRELDGVGHVDIDKVRYVNSNENRITLSTADIITHADEPVGMDAQDTGTEPGVNITAQTLRKPTGTNEGEGTVIAVLDNEFYLKGKVGDEIAWSHATYKPLPSGTVERFKYDDVKALATGKKIHASAGFDADKAAGEEGSLYFNNKVPFYYDYGGTSPTYGGDGVPDNDVISTIAYHGTHVSSLVGGNANEYKGLAPKCQLVCMKVFTEYKADETGKALGFASHSGGHDSAILAALEDAIVLGVDGINMSLGSDLDDFDQDTLCMRTIARLAGEEGIMSAISAGNGGKGSYSFTGGYGAWTTDTVETGVLGSYANCSEATIIASAQPDEVYFKNGVTIVGTTDNVAYEDQIVNREGVDADYPEDKQMYLKDCAPVGGKVGWVYIPNFGASADYAGKDVNGKIAVVNRGSTSFIDKYNIALQNGAVGLLIINNDPTANEFNFRCSFGDGFSPTIPAALALYKDKPVLEAKGEGEFTFIEKKASANANAKTMSTFSNDGARFNYDLKPDVAAPGDSIKGAIPPQTKEDKQKTSISTYEYLSGTSMSAPNYAGSQALLLGQKAKDVFSAANVTDEAKASFVDYRRTIDMRLMSTANMMMDAKANPETNVVSPTSPRIQGAGLIDLTDAINTKVYLNGLDAEGKEINKSKIQLRNNDDIAKGQLKMSFNAYNETDTNKSFKVKLTVMRPALEQNNKVIQDKYNYTGEVDDISKLAGFTYWKKQYVVGTGDVATQFSSNGIASQYDCVKLTKQVEYYATKEDCENDTNKIIIAPGYYYNAAASGYDWKPLPDFTYQSISDVIIYQGETGQTVSLAPGKNPVTIDQWNIPDAEKDKIAAAYEFGCAIEGYVELIADNAADPDLSIPFLGFYSLADKKNGQTLRDARVAEPFEFDKVEGVSYPSDLVNDLTKSLLGKNKADFGSLWVTGYAENIADVDVNKVLKCETSFDKLTGFRSVGKDPSTGSYYDSARDAIYVGAPDATNTMIIQQFMMRSVEDNYFTITNKDGKVVYKSVLADMVFGDTEGRYTLYKSHVDSNLIGGGYVAHRAYAVIPLYDFNTNEPFADGEYTLEFNYQLSYDDSWVSSSYNFIIDATAPSINSIETYVKDGAERVRINLDDQKVAAAVVGYSNVDVLYDADKKQYYLDLTREELEESMAEVGEASEFVGKARPRLYLELTDAAYGTNKVILHFNNATLSEYEIAESNKLAITYDFKYNESTKRYEWVDIDDDGLETEITIAGVNYKNNFRVDEPTPEVDPNANKGDTQPEEKGCCGSVVASSSLILISASLGLAFLLKKRKIVGGQK